MKRGRLVAALVACTGCSAILGLTDPIPADGSEGSRCNVVASGDEPFACQAALVCAGGRCRQPCAAGFVCAPGARCVPADDFATSARHACVPGDGPGVDGGGGADGTTGDDGATDGGLVDGASSNVEVLVQTGGPGLTTIGATFGVVTQPGVPRQIVFLADGLVRACDAVGCGNASRSLLGADGGVSAVAALYSSNGGIVWTNQSTVSQCLANFDAGTFNCPSNMRYADEPVISALGSNGNGSIAWLRTEPDGGIVLRGPVSDAGGPYLPATLGGTFGPSPASFAFLNNTVMLALGGTAYVGSRSGPVRAADGGAGSASARPGIAATNLTGAGAGDYMFWLAGAAIRRCRLSSNDCASGTASVFYASPGAVTALAVRGDSAYYVEQSGASQRLRRCLATPAGTCDPTAATTIAEVGGGAVGALVLDGADAFLSFPDRIVRVLLP